MKALCNANLDVLEQLKSLIRHCYNIYADPDDASHSGIGQHVRHVLDHYRAFRQGLDARCVDYNLRTRNSPSETCPETALRQIDDIMAWLARLDIPSAPIQVISEIALQRTRCEQMPSHTEREMLYLINHAIHHMAYAALLARQQGVPVPTTIGLAPGTASYQRTQKEDATHA